MDDGVVWIRVPEAGASRTTSQAGASYFTVNGFHNSCSPCLRTVEDIVETPRLVLRLDKLVLLDKEKKPAAVVELAEALGGEQVGNPRTESFDIVLNLEKKT